MCILAIETRYSKFCDGCGAPLCKVRSLPRLLPLRLSILPLRLLCMRDAHARICLRKKQTANFPKVFNSVILYFLRYSVIQFSIPYFSSPSVHVTCILIMLKLQGLNISIDYESAKKIYAKLLNLDTRFSLVLWHLKRVYWKILFYNSLVEAHSKSGTTKDRCEQET